MDDSHSDCESVSDSDDAQQESSVNLSASQLVDIMNCAMKRRKSSNPTVMKKRPKLESGYDASGCSNSISSHELKTKQDLIERNIFLEKRVKELEKLNQMMQYGLVNVVKQTIMSTMKESFSEQKDLSSQLPLPLSPEAGSNDNKELSIQTPEGKSYNNGNEENSNMIKPVAPNGIRALPPELVPSVQPELELDEDIEFLGNQMVKGETENDDEPSSLSVFVHHGNSPQFCQPQAIPITAAPVFNQSFSSEVFQRPNEQVCNQSRVTVDKVNEMMVIVNSSQNYKKLTHGLVHLFFNREELAMSTLTGRWKGDVMKNKLDEATVDLIIRQVKQKFPTISNSDVRVIISQDCKDQATRMLRYMRQANLSPSMIYNK